MLSKSRILAYARTMDAGLRTIEEVDEDYRVAVYLELIARYKWDVTDVDIRYIEQVKSELGMK